MPEKRLKNLKKNLQICFAWDTVLRAGWPWENGGEGGKKMVLKTNLHPDIVWRFYDKLWEHLCLWSPVQLVLQRVVLHLLEHPVDGGDGGLPNQRAQVGSDVALQHETIVN